MNTTIRPVVVAMALAISPIGFCDSYHITVHPNAPLEGTVTLTFDPPLAGDAVLGARSIGNGQALRKPQCGDMPISRKDRYWVVPEACSAVSWKVDFVEVGTADYAVSTQQNIYHPSGWWVLSEWDSLLRRSTHGGDAICTFIDTQESSCRTVPSMTEPPLLLTIGQPGQVARASGITFRVFSDGVEQLMDIDSVFSAFERQLNYLTTLLPQSTGRQKDSPIDIVWLAIDPSHGVSSGAGGFQSIMANYVTSSSGAEVVAMERFRLLWVSGHEILHLLGINVNALWASESLPTYYSFKSFAGLPENAMATEFFAQLEADSQGPIGILEAQRLATQGHGQHMVVVYGKGAAFWRELDTAIQEKSAGGMELDDFLPALLAEPFSVEGMLPPAFTQSIRDRIPGLALEEVVRKYL